jgi:hypothetical protein
LKSHRARLTTKYVKLSNAIFWDRNPKEHDIPAIVASIKRYGFRDPPEYDGTLGAIVAGNGRTTALMQMQASGSEAPLYIDIDEDGEWLIPMIFGADAESQEAAERYGMDHNLLTLGTPKITPEDLESMFRGRDVKEMFGGKSKDELPITLSPELLDEVAKKSGPNELDLNFEDKLAEGFAHQTQFGNKVQLIVDLTKDQADNADLKQALIDIQSNFGVQYRIKTKK